MQNESLIPRLWRKKLLKANNLSEVAELFNKAEQFSDFDCCAELEVWCKDHPAKMAGLDKPIYIFAETESEELVYSESTGKWFVKNKS